MSRKNIHNDDEMIDPSALTAALEDRSGWRHPCEGFAERAERYLLRFRLRSILMRHRGSRWGRIAAIFTAIFGIAAFAAWFGASLTSKDADVFEPVDAETATITKTVEGNTMIMRKAAGLVGAAVMSVSVPAAELTSEPTFVFLRPETSSFWHTATNNVMTVPIDFPTGATSATLDVTGLDYSRSYPNITEQSFTFELPAPTSMETENVYDLALTFNDGTVRRAKLGLIQGLSPDGEGVTRCIAPANGSVWTKNKGRAVLPIPYGTTSFKINGEETATGLDGAQGWYPIKLRSGRETTLSIIANEINYTADLIGGPGGFMVIVR